MTSKSSLVVEYVRDVVLAHSDTLNLTDPSKLSLVLNVNEPFSIQDTGLPYVQLVAPLARTITKTQNVSRKSIDFSIQLFFRPTIADGPHNGLDIMKLKHDVATDLELIVDQIERNQITDSTPPDCWLENPSSVIIEKSTLYSEPDDLYPPYVATASFTLFFDEEYT
jgi:hypothetical protein